MTRVATPARPVLEARNLRKAYGAGRARTVAVDRAALRVDAGDFVVVMGPSGGGKTTLLAMLGGLATPDNGQVRLQGRPLDRLASDALADARSNGIGFVFQNFQLLGNLRAWENVEVPLRIAGMRGRRERRRRAMKLLRDVGLHERAHARPDHLSGGEKQRVAFARAIANDPSVILADEPTANLDSATGARIMELLGRYAAGGGAVVVVSHDPRVRAYATRVFTMADGRLRPA